MCLSRMPGRGVAYPGPPHIQAHSTHVRPTNLECSTHPSRAGPISEIAVDTAFSAGRVNAPGLPKTFPDCIRPTSEPLFAKSFQLAPSILAGTTRTGRPPGNS